MFGLNQSVKDTRPATVWIERAVSAIGNIGLLTILFLLFSTCKSASSVPQGVPGQTAITTSSQRPSNSTVAFDENPVSLKECLVKNGLAYGPFRDGQAPSGAGDLFPFPTSDQIDEDIILLKNVTNHIRVYASSGDYSQIAQLAKAHKVSVMQGIHLRWDPRKTKQQNDEDNRAEIEAAVELAQKGLVNSIIVGNETFLRSGSGTQNDSTVPKDALIRYIREIKKQLPSHVQVSTAQVYADWEANLDLADKVDFVVAHFYPFWEPSPVPANNAAAAVFKNYDKLKADLHAKYGHDVKVVIGETGWPSGGEPRGDAVPSPENQRKFIKGFMTEACNRSIPFYYFSAFDEEWKWQEGAASEWAQRYHRARRGSELPNDRTFSGNWIGSSWGIFQSNGQLKPLLKDLFAEQPQGSRKHRDIFLYDIGRLSTYYDMGVESDPDHFHDWLRSSNGVLAMAYPPGQHWGSVFITVGKPKSSSRPWKDFSEFNTLSIEMRGQSGGEKLEIGIKNRTDPDNGHETRIAKTLTRDYRIYDFPLEEFASKTHLKIPQDLRQLYTIVEFVFHGQKPETVYVKNIRYESR